MDGEDVACFEDYLSLATSMAVLGTVSLQEAMWRINSEGSLSIFVADERDMKNRRLRLSRRGPVADS